MLIGEHIGGEHRKVAAKGYLLAIDIECLDIIQRPFYSDLSGDKFFPYKLLLFSSRGFLIGELIGGQHGQGCSIGSLEVIAVNLFPVDIYRAFDMAYRIMDVHFLRWDMIQGL